MRNAPNHEFLQARRLTEASADWPHLRLNDRWRVIACKDSIQFILQRLHGPESPAGARFEGRSYCRTTEALIRCCRAYCGPIDPTAAAVLAALPARFAPGCLAAFTNVATETKPTTPRDLLRGLLSPVA